MTQEHGAPLSVTKAPSLSVQAPPIGSHLSGYVAVELSKLLVKMQLCISASPSCAHVGFEAEAQELAVAGFDVISSADVSVLVGPQHPANDISAAANIAYGDYEYGSSDNQCAQGAAGSSVTVGWWYRLPKPNFAIVGGASLGLPVCGVHADAVLFQSDWSADFLSAESTTCLLLPDLLLLLPTNMAAGHWSDLSGAAHHASQANTLHRPTMHTVDGQSHLHFDDTTNTQFLSLDWQYAAAAQVTDLTVCAKFRTSHDGSSKWSNWGFVDFDRSEAWNFFLDGTSGRLAFSTYSGGVVHDMTESTGASLADNQWHVGCAVLQGSTKSLWRSGDTGLQKTTQATAAGGLVVKNARWGMVGDGSEATSFGGARNDQGYHGDLASIAVWSSALSSTQLQNYVHSMM